MPRSQSKENRMLEFAYEMARSGDYNNWWSIEVELRMMGHSRARQLLDNERVREELDRLCAEAGQGR